MFRELYTRILPVCTTLAHSDPPLILSKCIQSPLLNRPVICPANADASQLISGIGDR